MNNRRPPSSTPPAVIQNPLPDESASQPLLGAGQPCCGTCGFGIPVQVPGEIRRMVRCHNGTACAIMTPVNQGGVTGMAVKYVRPIWPAGEFCYLWRPQAAPGQS